MTYTRRISSKGGITIPQRLRHEAGLIPGIAVDIVAIPGRYSTEISLGIRPHAPTCRRCGSIEGVIDAEGITACRKCLREMLEVVSEEDGNG